MRQAALRGHRPPRAVRRPARPGRAPFVRQGRAHHHHHRQGHRPVAPGSHRPPRHHRQKWYQGLHEQAQRRPESRRAAHRPVWRGLLLGLHRGRQDHGRIAPCGPARRAGRALGERRCRRLRSGRHHARRARHEHHAAPARRRRRVPQRLEAQADRRQVFRPHLAAHPHGKGGVEGRRERPARRHGQDRRMGNGQQGQRPVEPQQERHHARAVRRVLQDRQPRLRGAARLEPQPRGRQHRVHAAALHPLEGPVRPVEPRARARASSST